MRALVILSLSIVAVLLPPQSLCEDDPAGAATTLIGVGDGLPSVSDYYPEAARAMGLEGTTEVHVCVGADGKLLQKPTVAKSSGRDVLDDGALEFELPSRGLRINPHRRLCPSPERLGCSPWGSRGWDCWRTATAP